MFPALALVVLAAALSYGIGDYPLLDEPNDGQYAEVGREMLEGGDWLTPHLNYVVFLNKPPLLYWLIAASYAAVGVNEGAARLPAIVATLLIAVLIYALGRELFDRGTGWIALCVFASMPATLLEGRFVRPDMVLTAATTGSVLAIAIALRAEARTQQLALWGLQIALAIGLLAKGIVGLLLPAMPLVTVLLVEGRRDLLLRLANPLRWWPFFALVIPWHAVVAWRHQGFLTDYVIQQHLLFFLDRKVPRDSTPIGLGLFSLAFLARLFPWTLFLPLAVVQAAGRMRHVPSTRRANVLLISWSGGIILFFTAAVSRLEHYALPAVPAFVLLIADLLHRWPTLERAWQRILAGLIATLVVMLVAAAWFVPALLRRDPWLGPAGELPTLARLYFVAFALGAFAALLLAGRRPRLVAPILFTVAMLCTPLVQRGLVAMAPLNSSAPAAHAVADRVAAGAEAVCEAPVEYQLCAGFNFYLTKRIRLLRPPEFVAPAYLQPYEDELFIDRTALADLWARTAVVFFSDPSAASDRSPASIVPEPFVVLNESGHRFVVSNDTPDRSRSGSVATR